MSAAQTPSDAAYDLIYLHADDPAIPVAELAARFGLSPQAAAEALASDEARVVIAQFRALHQFRDEYHARDARRVALAKTLELAEDPATPCELALRAALAVLRGEPLTLPPPRSHSRTASSSRAPRKKPAVGPGRTNIASSPKPIPHAAPPTPAPPAPPALGPLPSPAAPVPPPPPSVTAPRTHAVPSPQPAPPMREAPAPRPLRLTLACLTQRFPAVCRRLQRDNSPAGPRIAPTPRPHHPRRHRAHAPSDRLPFPSRSPAIRARDAPAHLSAAA